MRSPSYAQCEQIAAIRGLRPIAIQLASELGYLKVADLQQGLAYIFKSSDGTNAQARLITGANFAGALKTKTLPGSRASWPIGIPIGRESCIALCEGGVDFLAAFDLIVKTDLLFQVAPVAILGAGHHIQADALSHFTGKRVRIFTHDDDAGRAATERWSKQLSDAGAEVDNFSFAGLFHAAGVPVKDLNDFLCMPSAEFAKHAPAAVSFATEKTTQNHGKPASFGALPVL
jgi:hypothetical protein